MLSKSIDLIDVGVGVEWGIMLLLLSFAIRSDRFASVEQFTITSDKMIKPVAMVPFTFGSQLRDTFIRLTL
jgi:hypothetical protein